MKILVTGYKGFIGQNMVQYLHKNTDWEVDTYDWNSGVLPSIIDQDWILHLGAISSTTERDIDKIMFQNFDFTRQLFDACKTYGVNLQYSSSASIYGFGTDFTEDALPDPKTPYAWSKYLVERYHRMNQGGNTVHGFRYFNVYGDGEEHKGSQASPISKFRNQETIRLFEGSTKYFRDFVCVEDVCRVHVDFIKNVRKSGVFNLGTGKTYSFQQVADLISSKQEYIPIPKNVKDSYQELTCSDNTKLEDAIGSQKWISIEEFLETRNNR